MDVLTMGRSWWITQILAMKSALLLAYQHINGIPSLPYPSIQRKSRIWTVKPRETWKGFIWFEKKNIESFFEFIYIKNSCMTSAKIWNSYSAVLPARQLTISLDGSSITSSIPSGKKPSGLITTLLYFFLIRTHLVPQLCQQNSTRSETTLSNYDWIDS